MKTPEIQSTMHQMVVPTAELLSRLEGNLKTHRETFLEAQEGYRDAIIRELDQMLKDAREGLSIKRSISLPEPHDHSGEYVAAIEMLKMCVDEQLVITAQDFQQYVMDDWGWKRDFMATASNYTKKI